MPPDQRQSPAAAARRWWVRLRLPLLFAAGLGLAALGLWGRLPDPRAFVAGLTGADYGWVTLAAALQALSLAAFAWQQRQLMRALGVRLTARRAAAVTLARTAISISMPAGAAVSAGYAVREYQRGGASKEISAASMIVSGLASIGGLALLYVAGGVAVLGRNPTLLLSPRPLAVVAVLAVLTTVAVLAGRRLPSVTLGTHRNGRVIRWIRAILASARDAWQAGASLRARDWIAGLLFFALNWLTDLLCLAATCRAVGLPVGITTLAGIYLGVQIVRQVPLTPGGVGVVDTAFVAGLTAAGATAATAAAAVLIYRLLSCWLLLPAGGTAALLLRRNDLSARATPRPRRRVTRP
ncbi:lysylphosphatidylglycerol synthase transmembrane domain-containing protein [Paractinoplanes toevensis]|uniref:lysylphosphatidylglycerol synthase transmembrane domain-containing protein n=1 Tax=Paractinoplanes toevensis TaxID=571911 RepID=UPI001FE8BB87|nr:lysylphosphatidylglycerol synthase transmembrane domain-containing protein [Actinoplanes toevensis]